MILVMDNASYHHQLNTAYYPEKKTPVNATKVLNAHVLRIAGCESIKVLRAVGGAFVEKEFTVPSGGARGLSRTSQRRSEGARPW